MEHYADGFYDVDVVGAYAYLAAGWDGLVILCSAASSVSPDVSVTAGTPMTWC